VAVKPTELQSEMIKSLSVRAAVVHAQRVDASVDNMLINTGYNCNLDLNQRLVDPLLPGDLGSKVNACSSSVYNV
jgi:hypothetical protein